MNIKYVPGHEDYTLNCGLCASRDSTCYSPAKFRLGLNEEKKQKKTTVNYNGRLSSRGRTNER
jgi:hypothetical protein